MVRPGKTPRSAGSVVFVSQSDLFGRVILVGEDGNEHTLDALNLDDRCTCFHLLDFRAGAEVEERSDAQRLERLNAIGSDLRGFGAAKDDVATYGLGGGSRDGVAA